MGEIGTSNKSNVRKKVSKPKKQLCYILYYNNGFFKTLFETLLKTTTVTKYFNINSKYNYVVLC